MGWVSTALHTTSELGVSSITTSDAPTSAASSRLNWRPCRFKLTSPFRRKTKSGFCACAITFQTQSTYLLIPWSRVLLERLKGSQLVKKFPTFYGTRKSTAIFTSARHLSLFWASATQSITPHSTSWSSILILSHLLLGLSSGLFPSDPLVQSTDFIFCAAHYDINIQHKLTKSTIF